MSLWGTRSCESVKMSKVSSVLSAVKLSMVRPEYFFDFLVREPNGESFREPPNKLRETPSSFFFSELLGALCGVSLGVGSDEIELKEVSAEEAVGFGKPSAAAASAVLLAVNWPDARRTLSAAGCRFFWGDMPAAGWLLRDLRCEVEGGGVVFLER